MLGPKTTACLEKRRQLLGLLAEFDAQHPTFTEDWNAATSAERKANYQHKWDEARVVEETRIVPLRPLLARKCKIREALNALGYETLRVLHEEHG